MDPPSAPDDIPAYVRDGIDRQDPETLAAIVEYCEARREYLERELTAEDLAAEEDGLVEDDEELVDVDEDSAGTIVVKRVPCGKDCGGCPHGPYKYRVSREGDSLNWEYLGKAAEGEE